MTLSEAKRPSAPGPVIPAALRPMLATAAHGPLDSPAHAYEVKWDGMRVLVGIDGARLSGKTRNGIEAAPRFPELTALLGAVDATRAVLDGELVRMVDARPNFWALQTRIQASHPRDVERLAATEPVELIVFDLLCLDGESWLHRPWEVRRARLEEVIHPSATVQLSPVWPDGRALWQVVTSLDLEGIVAKRRDAPYAPGERTTAWLKIKAVSTLDLVVGGWSEGAGGRRSSLGALLVGEPTREGLIYRGSVGTGFDQAGLVEALRLLAPLEAADCPFNGPVAANARAHWVRPQLVCEVRHQGWSDSHKLRAPVFLRWRPDLGRQESAARGRGHGPQVAKG